MKILIFVFLAMYGVLEVVAAPERIVPVVTLGSKDQGNITRIVYPSEDTNKNRRPAHNRQPIADSRLCFVNELLYPGDNEGDWVCDCKPGYLHTPFDGRCYEAYTQGPCLENQIITLLNISSIPECVSNPCEKGKVLFNEKCYKLNDDEGCKQFSLFIGRKVLLVADPTTLGLICADEDFLYECVHTCCIGSKREYRNICKPKRKRLQKDSSSN